MEGWWSEWVCGFFPPYPSIGGTNLSAFGKRSSSLPAAAGAWEQAARVQSKEREA